MRDDYLQSALKVIDDPYILVNVVSRRVKQLKRGYRPLVESLEKLAFEDTALREIFEGKITYRLATAAELARSGSVPVKNSIRPLGYQVAPVRAPRRKAKPAADPALAPSDDLSEPVLAEVSPSNQVAETVALEPFHSSEGKLATPKFTLVPAPPPLGAVA
jgi:DNA-directed RNA polymerase subunit omega